jgi:ABC-type Fe3+/spermidine/putrescine transport system ATPase subunit
MELIRLDDVDFAYGDDVVLRSFNLALLEHHVTVLVGPSGSGKTTVLRLIAGFEAPRRGRVLLDGEIVAERGHIVRPPESRRVSVVFQDLALWPHMTVRETLELVLGSDVRRDEGRRRIEETLLMVGLERHVDARPAQLSGGERQRLAIARAIVTRPRIVLMDEPLANLDPPLRVALLAEIRRLHHRLGLTILYITHNQQETFILGDRAAVIRNGRIEQIGTPRELYERPRSVFVASFLGRCAILPGVLRDGTIETALGPLAPPWDSGVLPQELFVLIRPEDVSAGSEGAFCGQVRGTTCLGDRFETEIDGPGWRLWAMLPREATAGSPFRFSLTRITVVHRDEA